MIERGETSIRQKALAGAARAWTTAALTTPPWVTAIAVPSSVDLFLEPGGDACEQCGQGLAAVGRGVRVGHPGAEVGGVDVGEGQAGPGAEVALGELPDDAGRAEVRGGLDGAAHRADEDLAAGQAGAQACGALATGVVEVFVGAERGRADGGRRAVAHEQQPPHQAVARFDGDRSTDLLWDDASRRWVAREETVFWLPGGAPVTVARPRRSHTGFPAPRG